MDASAADISVGFSDSTLLTASITGFCLLAATVYWVVVRRTKTRQEVEQDGDDADPGVYERRLRESDVSNLTRAQRRARAHMIMKEQRRATGAAANEANEQDAQNANTTGQQQQSRKQRQRLAKEAELKERRVLQEERQKQQLEAQKQAARERDERAKLQAQQAAHEKQVRQEQKAQEKEQEELAWETFLSSGSERLTVQEWVNSLQQQPSPCRIPLTPLSERFGVPLKDLESRIDELVRECRVAGVLEGSHFIYFTDNDLKSIAARIEKAGAVSLSQIALMCNEMLRES